MAKLSRQFGKDVKGTKKRSWKKWAAGLFTIFAILFYWWGVQPIVYNGTILFGLCRTYIELNTQYPERLEFVDLRERGAQVYVEYVTEDTFGQNIPEEGICTFKRGPNQEVLLDTFRLRRGLSNRSYSFPIEEQARIERFNPSIPAIIADPPPLYVYGPARNIEDMRNR